MYSYKQRSRHIDKLLKENRDIFHTRDLALLWDIEKPNTLYQTITRYADKGILIPIQRGLYSTKPLAQLDPVAMGIAYLHRYAYLSTETILTRAGVLNQTIPQITLISDTSRSFSIGDNDYKVRQMKDTALHNTYSITVKQNYSQATPERAAADLLYYNPHYHLDNPNLLNRDQVKQIQKEVGLKP